MLVPDSRPAVATFDARAFRKLAAWPETVFSAGSEYCPDPDAATGVETATIPEDGMADPTLTDAGGKPVSALPGASTFDSAMSFGLLKRLPSNLLTSCVLTLVFRSMSASARLPWSATIRPPRARIMPLVPGSCRLGAQI